MQQLREILDDKLVMLPCENIVFPHKYSVYSAKLKQCTSAAGVISSISSTERGEVFYRPTDWLGSRDPLTPVRYTRGSSFGLDD